MIFLYFTQSFCQREAEGGNDIEKAISGEEHGYAIVSVHGPACRKRLPS
jgi:hypothetical protein